ncbi:MAG: hypothetical protein WD266_00505 [Balneolales bacterium]
MKHFIEICITLLVMAILSGCDTGKEEREETVTTGELDATRMVTMGNSLTAGIMDGGWTYDGLRHSYATQIARQIYGDGRVGDDPAEHQFLLGRIKEPGNPVPATIDNIEQIGVYEDGSPVYDFDITPPENRLEDDALRVENYNAEPNFNNLAVPGFMGLDVLHTYTPVNALDRVNPFFSLPLRDRGSQYNQALQIDPTFVILWVGNNEALGSALSGGVVGPYPPEDESGFPAPGFRSVLQQLLEPYGDGDTKIIMGTVPDVTSIPFVTEVGVATDEGVRAYIAGTPGDPDEVWSDTLTFYGQAPEGIVRPVLASEYVLLDWLLMDPFSQEPVIGLHPDHPLPDSLWLSGSQLEEIGGAVDAYNNIIMEAADQSDNIVVADINEFFNSVLSNGGIDGFEMGLFGGLFSLDGVHPNKVGHAYIANEFIQVLNNEFGAQIATLNPEEYVTDSPFHQGRIALIRDLLLN